jgi:hypothetical protein
MNIRNWIAVGVAAVADLDSRQPVNGNRFFPIGMCHR